jgi:apocytochrome f
VAVGDSVAAGAPLTNDPNVGGFGQIDAEIVLQNPVRIYGLLAFFAAIALAQIMLVLKKRQVEKVQAAEGIV